MTDRAIHFKAKLCPNFAVEQAKRRLLVDHTYFDFSLVGDKLSYTTGADAIGQSLKSVLKDEPLGSSILISVSSKLKRNIRTFPMKLMMTLSSADALESGAIRWLPHGRLFIVVDAKKFEKDVMPKYFGHCMLFKSFLRQVVRIAFDNFAHA